MDQPIVEVRAADGIAQPDEHLANEQGEAGCEQQGEEDEPFYGFEPAPDAQAGHPRRSRRIPKPSEIYRQFGGFQANADSFRASEGRSNQKVYGKLDLSLNDALSSQEGEKWKTAIEDELKSFKDNGTWELVSLPPERIPIKSKWIFELKPGYDGVAERYKARLVALGCSQRAGLDYNETFAPVVRLSTLRIILSLVAVHDLDVIQLDVKTAFLYGRLEEEVYMRQPEGYAVKGREDDVCRLIKSIYGLKQAPRV